MGVCIYVYVFTYPCIPCILVYLCVALQWYMHVYDLIWMCASSVWMYACMYLHTCICHAYRYICVWHYGRMWMYTVSFGCVLRLYGCMHICICIYIPVYTMHIDIPVCDTTVVCGCTRSHLDVYFVACMYLHTRVCHAYRYTCVWYYGRMWMYTVSFGCVLRLYGCMQVCICIYIPVYTMYSGIPVCGTTVVYACIPSHLDVCFVCVGVCMYVSTYLYMPCI